MKQSEIWLADLEPVKGSEQGKTRPVVIISGNIMNTNFPVVIICPLTTSIKNYEGCVQLLKSKLNGLSSNSEIITFQIRTVSKDRLIKKLGSITSNQLSEVKNGLNDVLKY